MESNQRGQMQSAYRVLVAGGADNLSRDIGDLWDSGKVASEQSNQVEYQGKPLRSRTRCYWKVRVWDKDGVASPWSEPSMWTVGLMAPGDFQAKWIGCDGEAPGSKTVAGQEDPLDLAGCKWVWFPGG